MLNREEIYTYWDMARSSLSHKISWNHSLTPRNMEFSEKRWPPQRDLAESDGTPMADLSQMRMSTQPRPGLVTLAGVLLFVLGAFQVVASLSAFTGAIWVASSTYGWIGTNLWFWGIVDALLAVVFFYASYDIFNGGQGGRLIGIVTATVSMIRWFFYLPYIPNYPWIAVVMLVLDFLVIWGLVSNGQFFGESQTQR